MCDPESSLAPLRYPCFAAPKRRKKDAPSPACKFVPDSSRNLEPNSQEVIALLILRRFERNGQDSPL
jgi:hypothetical protein